MRILSSLIVLLALLLPAAGSSTDIYNAAGQRITGGSRSKGPKIVVDTVRMVGGRGVLKLNKRIGKGIYSVQPKSKLSAFVLVTPVISDTSKTLYYYSVVIEPDSLVIKSSNAADSGKVMIQLTIW